MVMQDLLRLNCSAGVPTRGLLSIADAGVPTRALLSIAAGSHGTIFVPWAGSHGTIFVPWALVCFEEPTA